MILREPILRDFTRALAALGLPILLVACSGPSEPPANGALVVGVQAEELANAIGSVHVVTKVDDVVNADKTFTAAPNAVDHLPAEIEVHGHPGAKVDVRVEAFAPGGTVPILTRVATSRLAVDARRLLRVQLDSRCVTGLACAAPTTCISGRCASSDVPPEALEDYEPGWAAAPPDICRPANHGPPEVILGVGQTDYASLTDGQQVQMELGPQGGHHVWIAVRMKNLRRAGSRTIITGKLEGDATSSVPAAAYVFTFDPDEGSYCKLWGLRFQLDSGASDLQNDYRRFLGKKLEITVQVVDSTNATASGTRTVQIADLLLCPDGTTNCNTK